MKNDLYSRLYIDAHLCRPECGDLGVIHNKTGKGIIYLTMFRGPWIVAVFIQNEGYEIITDELCNKCGDTIQIVRQLSSVEYRYCKDCNSRFFIETVEWSTHSFTVIDNQLARDRYFNQCPSHYGPQDESMMFV